MDPLPRRKSAKSAPKPTKNSQHLPKRETRHPPHAADMSPPPSPARGATFSAPMACLATKNQPKQPTFAQEKNQPPIPALRTCPLPPSPTRGATFSTSVACRATQRVNNIPCRTTKHGTKRMHMCVPHDLTVTRGWPRAPLRRQCMWGVCPHCTTEYAQNGLK